MIVISKELIVFHDKSFHFQGEAKNNLFCFVTFR